VKSPSIFSVEEEIDRFLASCIGEKETHVDFPENAPYYAGECEMPNLGKCTKFTDGHSGQILFPKAGKQVSTQRIREISMADVGAHDTEHWVTKFYMSMLGDPKCCSKGNFEQRLGFYSDNTPAMIIVFTDSNDGKVSPVVRGYNKLKEIFGTKPHYDAEKFWLLLKKMAAEPEFRILLHRIITEIRRTYESKQGALEFMDGSTWELADRNWNRCVTLGGVSRGSSGSGFSPGSAPVNKREGQYSRLEFDFNIKQDEPCLYEQNDGTHLVASYPIAGLQEKVKMAVLYHEFLHWYCVLRSPVRTFLEANAYYNPGNPIPMKLSSSYYWGELSSDEEKEKVSGAPWSVQSESPELKGKRIVNFHEMRVVLGAPQGKQFCSSLAVSPQFVSFLEGDDMSENRFRQSIRLPLRGVYTDIGSYLGGRFLEDHSVVKKFLETAGTSEDILIKNKVGEQIVQQSLKSIDALGTAKLFFREDKEVELRKFLADMA
jgi:hypothetical protein